MTETRPHVIDADGHFCEPWRIWTEYTDAAVHDLMPHSVGIDDDGYEVISLGGGEMSSAPLGTGASITPGGTVPTRVTTTWAEGHPGGFDPALRLRDLDLEGIDEVVLYPSLGLALNAVPMPDVVIPMCRALNRFLFEYCSENPRRLFGVATLPLAVPEEAAVELERCVNEYGFVAAMIQPKPCPELTLRSPELEPVWAAAERLDVAIGLHPMNNLPPLGIEHLFGSFFEQSHLGFGMQSQVALVQVLSTGLLDRHPGLRFTVLESGIGWLPSLLDHMDSRFRLQRSLMTAPVHEPPSETFARHFAIAGEAEERILGAALELLPEGTYMFSSDYPHHESEFPHTIEEALARDDLSPRVRNAYLADNARRFYQLA